MQPCVARSGHKKDNMATGKVRIFELAKELGMSSKDLVGLFERLGLEAKNQLSVVEPPIADLVRGVLLGGGKPAKAPPPARSQKPARRRSNRQRLPPAKRAKPAAPVAEEPVPTLKPVPRRARRTVAKPAAPAPGRPRRPLQRRRLPLMTPLPLRPRRPKRLRRSLHPSVRPARRRGRPHRVLRPPRQAAAAPAAGSTAPPPPRPRPPAAPLTIPRSLSFGRSHRGRRLPGRVRPRNRNKAANGVAASAAPGPASGIPGRPGVAPRPGQPGVPRQGGTGRGQPTTAPPRPGQSAPVAARSETARFVP